MAGTSRTDISETTSLKRFIKTTKKPSAPYPVFLAIMIGVFAGLLIVMTDPKLAVAGIIALSMGLYFFFRLSLAFWIYIFVLCCVPKMGLNAVGVSFSLNVIDILLLGMLGTWLTQVVVFKQPTKSSVLTLPVLLYLLTGVVAALTGLKLGSTLGFVLYDYIRRFFLGAIFFLLINIVDDLKGMKKLLLIMFVAAAIASLFGLYTWAVGPDGAQGVLDILKKIGYTDNNASAHISTFGGSQNIRISGTFGQANVLGGYLMVLLVLLFYTFSYFGKWKKKVFAMGGIIALCFLLTLSRSAYVGLFGVFLLGLFTPKRNIFIAAAILFSIAILATPGIRNRLLKKDSVTARFDEYEASMKYFKQYPILGCGLGMGTYGLGGPLWKQKNFMWASSLYLAMINTAGLLCLSAFGFLILRFYQKIIMALRKPISTELKGILLGIASGVMGILFSGLFDHYYFTHSYMVGIFWVFMGLGAVALREADKEIEKQGELT